MFDGVTKYFKFTVLPFGLSLGPYIFSKVMRPLVKYWRTRPLELLFISTMVFLRPQIFPNAKGILCLSGQIFSSLALLPTKVSVSGFPFRSFVGWVFFGISKTTVCLDHRRRFQGSSKNVVEIMSCCSISARKFARVTGRIISNFLITGDVCMLMTKSLHHLVEC